MSRHGVRRAVLLLALPQTTLYPARARDPLAPATVDRVIASLDRAEATEQAGGHHG